MLRNPDGILARLIFRGNSNVRFLLDQKRTKKIKNKRMRQRALGESCKSIKVVLSRKRQAPLMI